MWNAVSSFWAAHQASALRLVVAMLLSGLVGLERRIHGRPAGLRTHVLVGLGSAVVMLVGADPGLAAAAVVAGVGFLGAGTIMRFGRTTRGLTTATSTWLAAGIGIAAGAGRYTIATFASLLAFLVLMLLHRTERRFPQQIYRTVTIVSTRIGDQKVLLQKATDLLEEMELDVMRYRVSLDTVAGTVTFTISLRYRRKELPADAADVLTELPGVTRVEWE